MEKPVNVDDLEWHTYRESERIQLRYKAFEPDNARDAHLGVCIQELPPGAATAPAHYHALEEEHVYVLTGELTVRLGSERYTMRAGSYIRFPAGTPREHCLENETDLPCQYLLVGERERNEVVVYPDSNKVQVRALREIYPRQPLDYWDGEER